MEQPQVLEKLHIQRLHLDKGAGREEADDTSLYFLCLKAGGGPNADECASEGALVSRPSAKMAFSLAGGCGKVSVTLVQKPPNALEFYYPRCRENKCPLPGSIHAALRFHRVNNLLKYFTFISRG